MEPATLVSLSSSAARLVPLVRSFTETARWEAAVHKQAIDVAFELEQRVRELEAHLSRLEAAMHEPPTEQEQQALLRLFFPAARDATTKERRQMLIDGLLGTAVLDHGAEMRSRVARAILGLEPSDVHVLAAMALRFIADARSKEERGLGIEEHHAQYDSLLAAGCIAPLPGTFGSEESDSQYRITETGRAVLATLRSTEPGEATVSTPASSSSISSSSQP